LYFSIKDSNGNFPIDLTTEKSIKKLINKIINPKKDKSSTQSSEKGYSFLKQISFHPPKPPKCLGFVEKLGSFLFVYRSRYIEIDPLVGSFRRYKSIYDYPSNPK
jgi:hypothetical protein